MRTQSIHCIKLRTDAILNLIACHSKIGVMTMEKQELVLMGIITSPHGIRGDVKIKSYTKPAEAIHQYPLVNDKGDKVTLKVKAVKKDMLVCNCNLSKYRDTAELLRNTNLYTEKSNLAHLEEDEFYIQELEGINVMNSADNQVIGVIKAVHNFGAGDIVEVAFKGGATEMLPFNKEVFVRVEEEGVYYTAPLYVSVKQNG